MSPEIKKVLKSNQVSFIILTVSVVLLVTGVIDETLFKQILFFLIQQ
jgi:hypothetical protein